LWPRSTADPSWFGGHCRLHRLEQLVIWPKLFRRIVPYLAAGFTSFDGIDAWLHADPVNRDDELFLLEISEYRHARRHPRRWPAYSTHRVAR
jgi:hypothetical protein